MSGTRLGWAVAFLARNRELDFANHCLDKGIDCYTPKAKRMVINHNLKDKQRYIEKEFAAFPGYSFVNRNGFFIRSIMQRFNGFICLAKSGGDVLIASDREIERIKSREASGEFDQADKRTVPSFMIGEKLIVCSGPMEGIACLALETVDDLRTMTRVEMSMFGGRPSVATVPVANLQKRA